MANQNKLKAWVRYDGTGRVIAGGPILQSFKPKVGNWVEINANECCNEIPTTTTTTTATPTTTTTTTIATINVGYNSESCGTPSTFTTVSFATGSNICDPVVELQGNFSMLPSTFYVIYGGFSRLFSKISDSIIQGAGGAPGECVSCG